MLLDCFGRPVDPMPARLWRLATDKILGLYASRLRDDAEHASLFQTEIRVGELRASVGAPTCGQTVTVRLPRRFRSDG